MNINSAAARFLLVARLLKSRVVIVLETKSRLGCFMKNSFSRLITLVVIAVFVVSCGRAPSNVLSGVKVESRNVDDDVWMTFSADLNLGAMNFASISIPVLHPRGQTTVGQLDLVSGLGGTNQLRISINVSEVSDARATQSVLPNGNLIPLIANNPTIAINIGNGAKVYLTISENVTAIGVAVPISAFDSIGQSLPGLNFFPVIYTDGVIGTAGIFTGRKSGQNGIAVVADVSQLVNLGTLLPSAPSAYLMQAEAARFEGVQLDYSSQSGSDSQKSRLDNMIFQLHQKKAVLRMKH